MNVLSIASKYVDAGFGKLVKKTFGGVTEKSAKQAIESVADGMSEEFTKAVENLNRQHAQKIDTFTKQLNSTKEEVAKLAREKNEVIGENSILESEKKKLSEKCSKIGSRIKEMLTFKKVKVNPDGSTEFVKHNFNGAKATKIVNSEGKVSQIKVELADGTFRRTDYDVLTEKPIRRITNANPKGDVVEVTYGSGKPESRILNVKKSIKAKPTVVSCCEAKLGDSTTGVLQKMSDGSSRFLYTNPSTGKLEIRRTYKAGETDLLNGWSKSEEWYNGSYHSIEKDWGPSHIKREIQKSSSGITSYRPFTRELDNETGEYIVKNKYVMPKDSEVKYFKEIRRESFNGRSQSGTFGYEVKMNNGENYYVDIDNIYKINKNGTKEVVDNDNLRKNYSFGAIVNLLIK